MSRTLRRQRVEVDGRALVRDVRDVHTERFLAEYFGVVLVDGRFVGVTRLLDDEPWRGKLAEGERRTARRSGPDLTEVDTAALRAYVEHHLLRRGLDGLLPSALAHDLEHADGLSVHIHIASGSVRSRLAWRELERLEREGKARRLLSLGLRGEAVAFVHVEHLRD